MTSEKIPWTIGDGIRVVSTVIVLVVLANTALMFLPISSEDAPSQSLITFSLLLLQEILIIAPLFVVVIRRRGLKLYDLGFRRIRVLDVIAWILKAYGTLILFVFVFTVFVSATKWWPPGFGRQESHIPLFGTSTIDLSLATIGLVFIAPIVEEIFFRGFLFQTLLSKLRPVSAALISAAIFAGIHFEFQNFGMMFFLGLLLTWMFYRSRSLWPGIGFHIVNNGLAFFLEWLVWKGYIVY